MKRIIRVSALVVLALATLTAVGCKYKTAPLPANAITAIDADINSTLITGHAAIERYEKDVTAGLHKNVTPTEKLIVNTLVKSLNIADPLYQAYHKVLQTDPGAPEPAELATAVSTVKSNTANAIALVNGGK